MPSALPMSEACIVFAIPRNSFQSLRLVSKERVGRLGERITKVFVEFTEEPAATAALNMLQVRCSPAYSDTR